MPPIKSGGISFGFLPDQKPVQHQHKEYCRRGKDPDEQTCEKVFHAANSLSKKYESWLNEFCG